MTGLGLGCCSMAECVPMGESLRHLIMITILTCCAPGDGYQPLIGLQDIKKLQHLTEDAVRDILRSAYRDSDLKIVTMGQLTDMSGTNDAFNSSICSLEVGQAFYQTYTLFIIFCPRLPQA